jgi:hypothetical protein
MAEPQDVAAPETPEETPIVADMDAAVEDIAESLGLAEAKEEKEEAQPAQGAGEKPEQAPPEGQTSGPGETPPPAAAPEWQPSTWRKEASAAWAALPPAVKAEVQKREDDIARYVSDTNVSVKVAKGIEKIIEPYAQLYQQYNVNPWDHMRDLLGAHYTLLFGSPEQKTQMFNQLAKNSGIDLHKLAEGQPAVSGDSSQYLDHVRALQQRIAQLEHGVGTVTSTVQEARLNELTESVLQFAQDPKHPFFDEVAGDIKALIDAGAVRTLTEAYETAVARNPAVRAKLVDSEISARRAAEDKKDTAHVARASKAMAGMPKSSGKGRATSPPETLDETLQKAYRQIQARENP